MRTVGKFVVELLPEWWGLMGSASFTFLGLYATDFRKSSRWVTGSSLVLGWIFFFVASYRVWKRQYDARMKAEAELNSKADIRGTITITLMEHDPTSYPNPLLSGLRLKCNCTNHGMTACEISKAAIVLSDADGKQLHRFDHPIAAKTVEPNRQYTCESTRWFSGLLFSELNESSINIYLMDSIGKEYTNITTKKVGRREFDRL
jgi:hypothetical protein